MKKLKQAGLTSVLGLAAKVLALSVLVALGVRSGQAEAATPRCDLGVNSQSYNSQSPLVSSVPDRNVIQPVNFTVQQWADKFTNSSLGLTSRQVANRVILDTMYKRQILGGVLTQKLSADTWKPMTVKSECDALALQLQLARFVAARNHTAAQARANGYTRTGETPLGGVGVHYQNTSLTGTFDPEKPAQILYDSTAPNAPIVGLSYFVAKTGNTPPAGFVGPNDRWHRISHWCLDPLNGNTLIAAQVLSQQECEDLGGTHLVNPGFWTLHVWVVPGCESSWGVFSPSNPRVSYVPNVTTGMKSKGCGSNTDVGSQLNFDRTGTGPKVY